MRCLLPGIFAGLLLCATGLALAAEPESSLPESSETPLAQNATAATESPTAKPLSSAELAFFEGQVRPLLVKRCYECHSAEAEELKGGLALDSRAGWEIGGDSGAALAPGKPDESLLIEAVRYESVEMPPKGKLPAEEIAILEKWVAMGAPDPRQGTSPPIVSSSGIDFAQAREFWSFQLPEPHGAPAVQNTAWPRDAIDNFVLAKLEELQLAPAADADNATWLRRVTYDLIGLPPTPRERTDFLADTTPEAREKVVDRLLASPQFGVHWGRHWLDVARYADSNGSDFNATYYNAWRYRNYVIEAFNRDEPFDQFIREQIAGDLLPATTEADRQRQLVGSTFLMIGAKMLSERDKEKLKMDVVDEQIDTVGKAFLGLTLGCARCHDHKFDPISTEEYYALAGIFNSTVSFEGESQQYVSTWVDTPLPVTAEFNASLQQFQQTKAELQTKLSAARTIQQTTAAQLGKLELGEEGLMIDDVAAKVEGHWEKSKFSPHFVGEGYLHDGKSGKGEKSITWTPDLPQAGRFEVRVAYAGSNGRDTAVPYTVRHAEGETIVRVDQSKVPPLRQTFFSLGTFRFEAGRAGSVYLSTAGTSDYVIADAVQFVPREIETVAVVDAAAEAAQAKLLANLKTAAHDAAEAVKKLTEEMKQLEARAPKPPSAMAPHDAKEIGDCQICIRGEVAQRGKEIPRGFLRVASDGTPTVIEKDESGRLELADWIARADHPLTARVMVNRIWQHLLGEGLVRSVDNFGQLGERPTHPALLDTLAVSFVEHNWSTKQLVRRIVLSRTYGQSTALSTQALELDPGNRFLWHANRKCLSAEELRDSMLQFSGELDFSIGESEVANMPRLAVDNNKQVSTKLNQTSRRTLFGPIIRNELPAFLTLFDFADPDLVTGQRPTTNVPAQALYLLNSPFVQQQASRIAERILAAEASDDARIQTMFQWILCRDATPEEMLRTAQFLAEALKTSGKQQPAEQQRDAWSQTVQCLLASTQFRNLE
jgi:hypothetical protein